MYRMKSVENNPILNTNKETDSNHQPPIQNNDAGQPLSSSQQQQLSTGNSNEQNEECQVKHIQDDKNFNSTENMKKPFQQRNNREDNSINNDDDHGRTHKNNERQSNKIQSRQSSIEGKDAEKTLLTSSTDESSGNATRYKKYNSFDREDDDDNESASQQNKEEETSSGKFRSLAKFATISKWWKKNVDEKISSRRKNKEKLEERKMRFKLQYHFMSPFEKYKLGRKPWKLGIQILKIILVTTQVLLFGSDRFASVAFLKHTHKSFNYIFIPGYDGSPSYSIYSRQQLVNTIKNVQEKYETLNSVSIGKYWHISKPPLPVQLCEMTVQGNTSNYHYSREPIKTCWNISRNTTYSRILNGENYFDRVNGIELHFKVKAVYLNGLILHHRPECLYLATKINFDNEKHDGRMRTTLKIKQEIVDYETCNNKYHRKKDENVAQEILIAFDILVITICSMSAFLCIRSVVKSIFLAKAAEKYFEEYRHEQLTKWDLLELINKWFPVIASSDLLSITGSIYKIYVDKRDIRYYNLSSLFLGVGVILVWVGFLRFFMYLKEYNALLITVRAAAPSLLQFMFCAMFIFFGFTFCGWVVLGPYHEKFNSFLTTAECLFSLVNGDDMYPTFSTMPTINIPVWIFSKIYIYVFVSLFIYVVLSTFISIVGDTYERLKDYGRMPPTRIECFITGKPQFHERISMKRHGKCLRCKRENMGQLTTTSQDDFFPSSLISTKTLSDSQLSLVSASLE